MFTDHLLLPFDPLRAAVGDYPGALQAEGKSPKTLRNYGDVFERFRTSASPVDPAAIDAGLLRRWLRAPAEVGLTGTTQHTHLTRVKSWLRWLEAEESYGVDAAFLRRVKPPRLDTGQPDPFTDEEVKRLFRACRSAANPRSGCTCGSASPLCPSPRLPQHPPACPSQSGGGSTQLLPMLASLNEPRRQ